MKQQKLNKKTQFSSDQKRDSFLTFDISQIELSQGDIKKCFKLPISMSENLAEEIGLHLGDGSMNYYSNKGFYQLRGHIKDDREHYSIRIKYLYKKLFNLDVNLRNMKTTGVIGFQIWNNSLVKFKHEILGLPLGKKLDFKIPNVIIGKNLFYAFMRGIFDTDGCLYIENKRGKPYPRLEVKTISKSFSTNANKLLNQYKINSTYHEYKRKEKNWNNLYTISIRGFSSVRKWMNVIGSNNPKHLKKWNLVESSDINGPERI